MKYAFAVLFLTLYLVAYVAWFAALILLVVWLAREVL